MDNKTPTRRSSTRIRNKPSYAEQIHVDDSIEYAEQLQKVILLSTRKSKAKKINKDGQINQTDTLDNTVKTSINLSSEENESLKKSSKKTANKNKVKTTLIKSLPKIRTDSLEKESTKLSGKKVKNTRSSIVIPYSNTPVQKKNSFNSPSPIKSKSVRFAELNKNDSNIKFTTPKKLQFANKIHFLPENLTPIKIKSPIKLKPFVKKMENEKSHLLDQNQLISNEDTSNYSTSEDEEFADEDIMFKTNYFVASASKAKTSDRTLEDIDLNAIQKQFFNSIHPDQKAILFQKYESKLFSKFYSLMKENFNIILYGLGSKKSLLDLFKEKWLEDEHHIVIYGFFTEMNFKHLILNFIDPLKAEEDDENALYAAAGKLKYDFFILIHSLDLLCVNDPKIKLFFTNLFIKSKGKIHFIASVDHLHSGLLFNAKETQTLNLVWLDATTFQNYQLERGYLTSSNSKSSKLLGLDNQHLSLSSVIHVYESLTPNAKQIFILILNYWIENYSVKIDKKNKIKNVSEFDEENIDGLPFNELYRNCREEFLVNSDLTLRTQLTEFKDHNLIKFQKVSGVETIVVLIDIKTIQKFLEKINDS